MCVPCVHVWKRRTGARPKKGVLPCGLRAARMRPSLVTKAWIQRALWELIKTGISNIGNRVASKS